jgi:hypothetical protein
MEVERSGLVKLPEQPLLLASLVMFSEHLIRPAQALPAPEVTALGIELAAVDAAAGALGSELLNALLRDLGDVLMRVPVQRDERDLVGVSDLAEGVAAAEGRLELHTLGMPAGGTGIGHVGKGFPRRGPFSRTDRPETLG